MRYIYAGIYFGGFLPSYKLLKQPSDATDNFLGVGGQIF